MVELELILCPKELFTCACAVQPYKVIKTVIFVSIELGAASRAMLELLKVYFFFEKQFNYFDAHRRCC